MELEARALLTDQEVAALRKKAHELFGGKSDAAFGDTVFRSALANVNGTTSGFKSTDGETGRDDTRGTKKTSCGPQLSMVSQEGMGNSNLADYRPE
jgi:hypothetical protein